MEKQLRAYSILQFKSFDEDERIIEGIATTPDTDRVGDIVEPMGAKFSLPMPLLWQHNHGQPVGNVEYAEPTKDGIKFRARLAKVDEPGTLKTRVDEAWQSIKAGLIRAVSIGFAIKEYESLKGGGWRIMDWDWFELSLVTIPANASATITAIRSIDAKARAASGNAGDADRAEPPGVTGKVKLKPDHAKGVKTMAKTIEEQLTDFRETLDAKRLEMQKMLDASAEAGETFSADEAEAYETLEGEVEALEKHVSRLEKAQKSVEASAKPVKEVKNLETGSAARAPVQVRAPKAEKGVSFARYAMALAAANGSRSEAFEIAQKRFADTPEVATVLKAAVAAGTTTSTGWAAELVEYQNMASEFIELLRPATILGKMTGMRRVPFNIKVPGAASGSTVNWVGEGKPKPVSRMTFNTTSLGHYKTAGIVVMTDELVRFSNPAAETLVREDLIAQTAQFLDNQLLDPAKAEVAGVSPASLTNGVTGVAASGTTADALRADFKSMVSNFLAANISLSGAAFVMSETQAISLALMLNPLGQAEFPGISMNGGTLLGLPVITSENVPSGQITLVKAPEVMLADDGEIMIDVSREASLQMDDAPTDPVDATTVMVSLWQHNMVGIRAERFINWKKRRAGAVQMITGANYA